MRIDSTLSQLKLFILGLTGLVLVGCQTAQHGSVPLNHDPQYYDYIQPSFEQYVAESRSWLEQNRRFVSDDSSQELAMNAPFIVRAAQPTDKAVVLVHGLGDSPFSFVDIAPQIAENGADVYVLLLPGHGSKPEDLGLPSYADWQEIVDHYSRILGEKYAQLWLGGFSTGANLITVNAANSPGISGMLLFSPGFYSQAVYLENLTPVVAWFSDWGWQTEEDNPARYSSSHINGAIAYSDSAKAAREALQKTALHIPALLVMSEADSVIDAEATADIFARAFTHPASKAIWYGETRMPQNNATTLTMRLPEQRISTGSHMSILFAPDNPFYGIQGQQRICENGYSRDDKAQCEKGADVWYSAWGYTEDDKIHARLTWNPYFSSLTKAIADVMQVPSDKAF